MPLRSIQPLRRRRADEVSGASCRHDRACKREYRPQPISQRHGWISQLADSGIDPSSPERREYSGCDSDGSYAEEPRIIRGTLPVGCLVDIAGADILGHSGVRA
jgi:hypothetical protein